MPDILVRDVPEKTPKQLKLKAKRDNRSLQQELKDALKNLSHVAVPDITARAASIRKKLAGKGRKFTDSAGLLKEDRCR
jgi:plasmid stability protein